MENRLNSLKNKKYLIIFIVLVILFVIVNDVIIILSSTKSLNESIIFKIINETMDDNINLWNPKTYITNKTKSFLITLVNNATKYCKI